MRLKWMACQLATGLAVLSGPALPLLPAHGQEPLSSIQAIEPGGQGIPPASDLAQRVQAGATVSLKQVIAASRDANPVAKNYLLGVAQALADQGPADQVRATLEQLLADPAGDPEFRYWALDRLAARDPDRRQQLLAGRIEDTSLDIRYEAIELAMSRLAAQADAATGDADAKAALAKEYATLLTAARLPSQVNAVADQLKELGSPVNLLEHYGFLQNWQVVAPFDNRGGIGFDIAYAPETEYANRGKLDTSASYDGKEASVTWTQAGTDKPDGEVDLNPIFSNEKGAVAYAYAEFQYPRDLACQVRLGCINANKVWVNGREALSNQVYHAGSQIDQYIGPAALKAGKNTVLVKICQNEQTESWAQNWSFQLRFTDPTGRAIQVVQ
jgi:hypothetical protein